MDTVGMCTEPPSGMSHLPIKILGTARRNDLEGWGWRFVERCPQNPDWWHAAPPQGWLESNEHLLSIGEATALLSIFIDEERRVRLQVYTPANGRSSCVEVVPYISFRAFDDTQQGISTVRVMGGRQVLQTFQAATEDQGKTTQDKLKLQARIWCGLHGYHKYEDPIAYW